MSPDEAKAMNQRTVEVWNDSLQYRDREAVAVELGIKGRTLRDRLTRLRRQGVSLIDRHWVNADRTVLAGTSVLSKASTSPQKIDEIHVVTAVQNNTNPHPAFTTLLNYCHQRNATLHCIPHRYMTKSVFDKDDEWYSKSFVKYLREDDVEIAQGHGVIMGSAKIAATAVNPTNRFESIGGNRWVFLGHPQIQMRMVPTSNDSMPKMISSSGSMVEQNYREGTAGKAAEFHHVIGATVIEVCGQHMHVRQLNADSNGIIYDIHGKYYPRKVESLEGIEAIITGDEHEFFNSRHITACTYGPGGIAQTMQPKRIVRHDVLDFWSGSHHHMHDPITQFVKHHSGTNSIETELDRCVQFLDDTTPEAEWFKENVIVSSNHPEHLTRWLKEVHIERDPENAWIYHKLWLGILESARLGKKGAEHVDPFEAYVRERAKTTHVFTDRNEKYMIAGIDVSQHGDRGSNGTRGSIQSFAKGANKMVIAHSHTPGINKGVYQVGHSTDGMDYAKGHSSWMNTHCLIYPNGKRTLIHVLPIGWYGQEQ